MAFPILFRQITDTFGKDDTISFVRIVGIKFEQDALFVEEEIQTRFGEIFNEVVRI